MDSATFKTMRAAMGLSAACTAARLNVSKSAIDLWEAGRRQIPEYAAATLTCLWKQWVDALDQLINPAYDHPDTLICYRTEDAYKTANPDATFNYHEHNALITTALAACASQGLPRKVTWA
ncbi:helix-turn-helix domain-containing protein [Actinotignum sp. GS-2025b]|uniref:helix-turn-helix domain-containing protein n=1 Tax=Actinotignum sp. GS-2025b TaxID=3427275 RepID=UPI003F48C03D